MYILGWILIIVLFTVLVLMFIWMWTEIKAKVPFIPVPNSILPYIYKALEINNESVVYDLGCGDARVLFYSANLLPKATYIGVENGPFPVIIARTLSWWNKKRNKGAVQILNKNFFDVDLSNATHIFVYLYPNVMDDLLPKFDKELKSGTRVVSTTFKFTQKAPIAEIDLERNGRLQIARKLYIYQF